MLLTVGALALNRFKLNRLSLPLCQSNPLSNMRGTLDDRKVGPRRARQRGDGLAIPPEQV
jgi:hypothetical protein